MKTKKKQAVALASLLDQYQINDSGQYISQEFQDFGYRLAMDLNGGNQEDRETISMCMRLAKTKPRSLLEQARNYVADAKARNKVALFLWKIKEIEKTKHPESKPPEANTLF